MTAWQFRQRPSDLMGIEDRVLALNFDCAGAVRLQREILGEREQVERTYL